MKRLLTIFVLCLATTQCFASIALVQSVTGGNASGSVAEFGTITSSAGGFSSTTGAGHLLVLMVFASGGVSGTVPSPTALPISGGYSPSSWSVLGSGGANDDAGFTYSGECLIYYIANAAPMTAAQTTTITIENVGSHTGTISVEFFLYEFSGVAASPVLDVVADDFADSGTPATTWTATTHTNLIICAMSAQPGSNLSAGIGYTLGINSTIAPIGQMQYQLNAAPGQTGAGFTGTDAFWSFAAVSFNAAPAGGGVPRHRGQVF